MSPIALHDAQHSLFVLVPQKGPVSLALAQPSVSGLVEALREIKPTIAAQRAARANMPVVVASLAPLEGDPATLATQLTKTLGKWGFTCVGFIEGSAGAEELADAADLVVMPAAAGCQFERLLAFREEVHARILREEEARAWDDALVEDAAINRAAEARAWDEAIAQDRAFEAALEAAREAARLKAEQERAQMLADWDEAIAQDRAFEARLLAQAWDEALAHDALVDQAEEAARQARDTVLAASPLFAAATPSAVRRPAPVAAPVAAPAAPSPAAGTDAPIFSGLMSARDEAGDIAAAQPVAGTAAAAKIHRARVRSGMQVYAEGGDLMMFGTVSSGGEIIADGNINAFGPVHGRIIAGANGNKNAHVTCQQFFAEIVSIGGRFITADALPADLVGEAVHFWLENDKIHFNRLAVPALA